MSAPRPDVAPPRPWAFPVPAEHLLGNGVRVLAHDLPGQYVTVAARRRADRAVRRAARQGGCGGHDRAAARRGHRRPRPEEFAELMERHGMVLGAGVSDGGLLVDVDVPLRHLATAAACSPRRWPSRSSPRTRCAASGATGSPRSSRSAASSAHRAAKELARTLWDPADRASRPTGGTPETVAGLTRDDLVEFHATALGPAGATRRRRRRPHRRRRPRGARVHGRHVVGAAAPPGRRRRSPPCPRPTRPGSSSSTARDRCRPRSSSAGPAPTAPRPHGWAPHPVISFVLGGSPSARVDAVLREEKGYTYGIRIARSGPRVAGGSFVTSGSVRSEVTGEAVEILLGILDGAREGFTDAELRAGVDYVGKTAPGRYATADAVADETAALALERLPLDFTTRNLRAVAALRREDLDAAYRRVATGEWTVVARRRRRDGRARPRGPRRRAGGHGCPLSTAARARSSRRRPSAGSSSSRRAVPSSPSSSTRRADGSPDHERGGSTRARRGPPPARRVLRGRAAGLRPPAAPGGHRLPAPGLGGARHRALGHDDDVRRASPPGSACRPGRRGRRRRQRRQPVPIVLPCHRVDRRRRHPHRVRRRPGAQGAAAAPRGRATEADQGSLF